MSEPNPPTSWSAPPPTMSAPRLVFGFDGGAATYFGTALLAALVTLLSLGVLAPWGIVMRHRWRAKHTIVNGHRLRFSGTAPGLFGLWLKWWLLTIVTLGIYSFWVWPRLTKWIVEHQEIDPSKPAIYQ